MRTKVGPPPDLFPRVKMANEFTEYCWTFYAPGECYGKYFGDNLTREELKSAVRVYMGFMGDFVGDTVDRERVRDLMLWKRGKL